MYRLTTSPKQPPTSLVCEYAFYRFDLPVSLVDGLGRVLLLGPGCAYDDWEVPGVGAPPLAMSHAQPPLNLRLIALDQSPDLYVMLASDDAQL